MEVFAIKGEEKTLTVNVGTLTYAEMLNADVMPEQHHRMNMGFALACFYGADMNCGITIEDLIEECSTAARYNELLEKVHRELDLFNGINEQTEQEGNSGASQVEAN